MAQLTIAQKRELIAKHIKSAAGRAKLAASMNRPLRKMRDYVSVGRRLLSVDPIADGQLPYYDKDPDIKAYIVGEEGTDVMTVAKGSRIFVPTFEIATLVTVPISQVKERRYDIKERIQTKTKAEVIRVEDQKIFNIIGRVANGSDGNAPIAVAANAVTVGHFSDAIGLVESHGDIRCANIVMNPKHNTLVRKLNSVQNGFFVDFETSRALVANGTIGTLFGATINTSSEVPADEIYFIGEPELVGVIVESIPLNVLSADSPERRELGWSVFEKVGIAIHNPDGVASIKLS
nr:MAG TPA: major capsid protein [Caudoviricetes sp.]